MSALINSKKYKSISSIEVIIAVSIFTMVMLGVLVSILSVVKTGADMSMSIKGTYLAEEGFEVMLNKKMANWSNLTDGTWGLQLQSNIWQLIANQDTVENLTRQITVETMSNDSTTNTVVKKITSSVSWGVDKQFYPSVLVTNWYDPVVIAGPGDWDNPTSDNYLNLSGNMAVRGMLIDADRMYIITANNLFIYDYSNPDSPTLLNNLSLHGTLNDIVKYDHYLYIASDSNTREFIVVDVSHSTPQVTTQSLHASFDLNKLEIVGNTLFVARDSGGSVHEFEAYELTEPTHPQLLDGYEVGYNVNDFIINGDYAYITIQRTSNNLRVIDISDLHQLRLVQTITLPGSYSAKNIIQAGDNIYVSRVSYARLNKYHLDSPSSLSWVDDLTTGGTVNAMDKLPDDSRLFLAVESTNHSFQVVDISENNFSITKTLGIGVAADTVEYSEPDDMIFLGTSLSTNEVFKITPAQWQ